MDKIKFKYDIMHLFSDRCEFKRFKRRSFFKILFDILISGAGYAFLVYFSFVLIMHLILHLIHVPIENYIFGLITPFVFFIILIIMIYYKQHRDVTIFIANIRKLYISKNRRILIIEYNDDNRHIKIKMVDMPDTDIAKQYIVNQLNNVNISIENNYSSLKQIKFYRHNLYIGITGLLFGLLFLFILLNMLPHNIIVLLLVLFSLSLCIIISVYSFYQLTKLKHSNI